MADDERGKPAAGGAKPEGGEGKPDAPTAPEEPAPEEPAPEGGRVESEGEGVHLPGIFPEQDGVAPASRLTEYDRRILADIGEAVDDSDREDPDAPAAPAAGGEATAPAPSQGEAGAAKEAAADPPGPGLMPYALAVAAVVLLVRAAMAWSGGAPQARWLAVGGLACAALAAWAFARARPRRAAPSS